MGALEGGAVAKGGTLNTANLKSFVLNYFTSRVKPKVDPIGAFVEPQFTPDDDFVMADQLTPKDTPVTIQFDKAPADSFKQFSVVGGGSQKLIPNKNGDNPWKLPLAMGHYSLFDPDGSLVIVSISWSRPPPALVKFARSLLRMSTLPYGFKRRQSIRLGTRRLAPSRRGDSQRSKANHRRRLISALGNIATSKALSLVGYQV